MAIDGCILLQYTSAPFLKLDNDFCVCQTPIMFNELKTAQIAAYFLVKSGGNLPVLKLMKLLYLADREAMSCYDSPLTFDRMVSMPHGPVLSQTYDLMSGNSESQKGGWEDWISDKEDHQVSINKENLSRGSFFKLSDADIELLEKVWSKYGHMGKWDLRNFTHDHCSEWKDPQGSSLPIAYEDVFLAVGKSPVVAKDLAAQINSTSRIDQIFDSL